MEKLIFEGDAEPRISICQDGKELFYMNPCLFLPFAEGADGTTGVKRLKLEWRGEEYEMEYAVRVTKAPPTPKGETNNN